MINEIQNMDCIKYLNMVKDDSVDLAVIDPPYNLQIAEWDKFDSLQSFLEFTFKWIDALLPKLKSTASMYVFNTPFNAAHILQHLYEKNMVYQNWITWDKRDGLSCSKKKYTIGQETILFFTKSKEFTFNYDDIRVPYESVGRMKHAQTKGILKNGKRWFPNPQGRLCGEVWHFTSERHTNKVNGKTQKLPHETVKPMGMIERIIKASSNKHDTVLDCFVGSGTTALACKNLDRNFLACDSKKEYALLARNRLESGQLITTPNDQKCSLLDF